MILYLVRNIAFASIWLCIAVQLPAPSAHSGETISVMVLVDEEEATVDREWTQRLGNRVQQASMIAARESGVRFVVREFGKWSTDNRLQDLSLSLREFERQVPVARGKLAIGFSSQYRFQPGRQNLGGTRGPLSTHILLRENSPSTHEPERLEALVHELGHFLGAAHSASPTSVMRPVVGDGQARLRAFQIGFDDHNAKILKMIGREIRERNVNQFVELSPTTLAELRTHYRELQQALPNDPSAARYVTVIDSILAAKKNATQLPTDRPTIRSLGTVPYPILEPAKPESDQPQGK